MVFKGKMEEYLLMEDISSSNCGILKEKQEGALTFIWFTKPGSIIKIDNIEVKIKENQVVCLTEFHHFEVIEIVEAKLIRFNKSFYCILNHDSEVGCKGVLFYGANHFSVIHLPKEDLTKFESIWLNLKEEILSKDALQLEMLQMILKRLLILSTRLYKSSNQYETLDNKSLEIVREFNFLVEEHFKTKSTIAEYADLLYKSPKTLSNVFLKLGVKSPSQFIIDRKMLEARRLLFYTDKSIKEIGYELGFEDIQGFSRFFKKNEGVSASAYKGRK